MPLHYNYEPSERYCRSLGLMWLGDAFIANADREAHELGFRQDQVDAALRHALWHIKWLFTPQNYTWIQRVTIALYFLFGKAK
jgi:hypothetical protein